MTLNNGLNEVSGLDKRYIRENSVTLLNSLKRERERERERENKKAAPFVWRHVRHVKSVTNNCAVRLPYKEHCAAKMNDRILFVCVCVSASVRACLCLWFFFLSFFFSFCIDVRLASLLQFAQRGPTLVITIQFNHSSTRLSAHCPAFLPPYR